MTAYAVNPHELAQSICKVLGEKVCNTVVALGEVTIEVPAQHYFAACSYCMMHPPANLTN